MNRIFPFRWPKKGYKKLEDEDESKERAKQLFSYKRLIESDDEDHKKKYKAKGRGYRRKTIRRRKRRTKTRKRL